MTPEEAEKAYAEASNIPLTEREVHKCVEWVLSQENKDLRKRCERLEKALREIIDKGMFVQMQDTPKAYADCAMACFWQAIAIAEQAVEETTDGTATTT